MPIPSDAHMLAFGRIMHGYAAVESGIKIALSGILQIGLAEAMISFQPHGALDLKNVAKSLAKERLKPELIEPFCCIVGDWAAFNALRNSIAHSRWTPGKREGSIKPRSISIREGRALWSGDLDDEADFTAEELEKKVTTLHEVNERLKAFLHKSGLHHVIEEMMDFTSA